MCYYCVWFSGLVEYPRPGSPMPPLRPQALQFIGADPESIVNRCAVSSRARFERRIVCPWRVWFTLFSVVGGICYKWELLTVLKSCINTVMVVCRLTQCSAPSGRLRWDADDSRRDNRLAKPLKKSNIHEGLIRSRLLGRRSIDRFFGLLTRWHEQILFEPRICCFDAPGDSYRKCLVIIVCT